MDWAAIGSRDAVRAVCARFRVDYAQAEAHLLGQQQRGQAAEERAEVLLVDDGAGGAGRLAATITQQTEKQEDDEEEEEEEEGGAINNLESGGIIPMLGQDLVSVCATVGGGTRGEVICLDGTTHGTGEEGGCVVDGPVAVAQFGGIMAMLQLPDGRVLVADAGDLDGGGCLRVLSADLQQVRTVAGNGEQGHRDGAAATAQFMAPSGLALLPDGRVLVADAHSHRIRVLSADLQQVRLVAGETRITPVFGTPRYEAGCSDGPAGPAAAFDRPRALALLPDGRVLIADMMNHRIRVLSADLQQVGTVVGGDGEGSHDDRRQDGGFRDGPAATAQLHRPIGLALLPDGRVLVTEHERSYLRVLSADLQQVSTVVGCEGECPHRDGAAVTAQFDQPRLATVLPDGRVLVVDHGNNCLRVLSADLQQVRTLTSCFCFGYGVAWPDLFALELLPDGRLLVGGGERIHVLEGFPAVRRGAKPSDKRRPQTTTQQQQQQTETEQKKTKKRALAGGASSSSGGSSMVPVPKRSRSGASSSSSMAAAPSSSDSESESEAQPGGAAAEAAPLL